MITGAARSGKSRYAEQLATASNVPVVYLATMQRVDGDAEQEQRILTHQQRRPSSWTTIERPYNLSQTILALPPLSGCCIVDCLSVYVSNMLIAETASQLQQPAFQSEEALLKEADELLAAMEKQQRLRFLVVTNEVGWGVVPATEIGRAFRDFLGLVNQKFAQRAEEVWLTCVGLPLLLKPQRNS